MSSLYELDPYLVSGSGEYSLGVAGEALGNRKLVYLGASGNWYLADADTITRMNVVGITMHPITAGSKGWILHRGFIGLPTWTWIVDSKIYASATAGELTQTPPAGVGDTIQVVGGAVQATQIYFNPQGGGGGTGCAVLEGATAYVGFDECKEPYANYFLCDGVADDVQINAAEAYVTGLGGGSVELERGTFVLADPIIPTGNRVWYRGQGRDTFIDGDGLATTEHAFHITGRTDIIISDMRMQTQDGGTKTCHCIFIEDGADQFLVDNVWIVASDSDGIHVEGTDINYGRVQRCSITGCDADGIYASMDAANYLDYLTVSDNDIWGNGGDGVEFALRVRDALVKVNQINDNTGAGVNISDASSTNNAVENNKLVGNTAGAIIDAGTGTRLMTVSLSFVDGSFLLGAAAPFGWEIDAALEYALALGVLPMGVQQVVRWKIWATSLVAEVDAMRLEVEGYGGASDEPYTTEAVAVADHPSETTNFAVNDVVYWVLDSGDDTDIDDMVGGDQVMIKVLHEVAGGLDCATDAVFTCVEIEYV